MSNGVICRGTLAAQPDNEILHTSFAAVLVPQSVLVNERPLDPIGMVSQLMMRSRGPLAHAIHAEYSRDLEAAGVTIPTLKEFTQSIEISASQPEAADLRAAALRLVERQAPRHYEAFVERVVDQAARAAEDDGRTLLRARSDLDAASRLEAKLRSRYGFFEGDFERRRSNQREADEPLVAIHEIGILFLERLRVRPLGHTIERAPFYELSIEPDETVTLRQKSFSKRATSFESTVEESEERQLEYSSTFTTELAEEYVFTTTNTDSIGLSHAGQFSYGTTKGGTISASHSGNYGATTSDSQANTESVRDAQTISRRVANKQSILHRTVISVATEDTLERESVRVIENRDTRTKKILMRRLMQVLHLSYERYGARMCWAPCIEEPGRDVRAYVPGQDAFKDELQAIRDRWASAPPPEELGPGPTGQEVCGEWSGKLSGGTGGESLEHRHDLRIPDGYEFGQAYLERRNVDGDPNVHIWEDHRLPQPGATGVVTIWVHVGLSGFPDPENINYRVCVSANPGPGLRSQRDAAVNAWRERQANKEIEEFLEAKRSELARTDINAWPISEITRRLINDYFIDPKACDCDLVGELERIFEWENLSYRLSAPWWRPGTPVDGLQSLRTTFLNASYARVFVPIRPGFEERAISWLTMAGAIPRVPDELEYYLADLRTNVLPQYDRGYRPSANDSAEIAGPRDVRLTELDAQEWDHAFERERGFKVLDRWTVSIPTDGVDFETVLARCDAATPLRDATETAAAAAARAAGAVSESIDTVAATVSIGIEAP